MARLFHRVRQKTLEYRKGGANGNADFFSLLLQPATEHDRSGSSRLTPADDEAIYLVRACDLHLPFTPVPYIGLGGLALQPDSAVLSGLPLTPSDFHDFRAHGARMKIDDLPALFGDSSLVFLLSSIPVTPASGVRLFRRPPTPLLLWFSL